MVCTGDDADASSVPLNKPVLLTDVLTASGKSGRVRHAGPPHWMPSQTSKTVTVVVRVAQVAKPKLGNHLNIIGGVTADGKKMGIKRTLLSAQSQPWV